MKDNFIYTGKVTMSSTIGDKLFNKKVFNNGNLPLFQLFAMALCGASVDLLRPQYINIVATEEDTPSKTDDSLLATGKSFVTRTLHMGTGQANDQPCAIISTNINGSNIDTEAVIAAKGSKKVFITLETVESDILAFVELSTEDITSLASYTYGTQLLISWELGINNPTTQPTSI